MCVQADWQHEEQVPGSWSCALQVAMLGTDHTFTGVIAAFPVLLPGGKRMMYLQGCCGSQWRPVRRSLLKVPHPGPSACITA